MSASGDRIPPHRWLAVGAAINERMSELGLDQADLAEEADLSAQVIRDLQRGVPKDYRSTTLVRVARALDWPVDAFPRLLAGLLPTGPSAQSAAADRRQASGVSRFESQVRDLERSLANLRRQLDAANRTA